MIPIRSRLARFTALASVLAWLTLPAGPALAAEDAEAEGLANVKQFTLDHNHRLVVQAELLESALADYAAVIAAYKGDYAAAWAADGAKLAKQIKAIRGLWLEASNQYETIEGIVAGIPETARTRMRPFADGRR